MLRLLGKARNARIGYCQATRDGAAAKWFFRRSYGVAHRELVPETIHSTKQYENNRVERSHEVTSLDERGMRKFKSM